MLWVQAGGRRKQSRPTTPMGNPIMIVAPQSNHHTGKQAVVLLHGIACLADNKHDPCPHHSNA